MSSCPFWYCCSSLRIILTSLWLCWLLSLSTFIWQGIPNMDIKERSFNTLNSSSISLELWNSSSYRHLLSLAYLSLKIISILFPHILASKSHSLKFFWSSLFNSGLTVPNPRNSIELQMKDWRKIISKKWLGSDVSPINSITNLWCLWSKLLKKSCPFNWTSNKRRKSSSNGKIHSKFNRFNQNVKTYLKFRWLKKMKKIKMKSPKL